MGSSLKKISYSLVGKSAPAMVRLSLVVAGMMPLSEAMAQIDIACQPIQYGSLADCGGGKVTVTPGGAVSTKGCIALLGTPQPGICKATGITSTTGSVEFKLSAKSVNISAGANSMVVSKLNIGTANGGRTYTYNSTTITGTQISAPIGARLNVSNPQPQGSYSGSLIMTVTFTP
jgi:hypothetical protein